MHVEVHMCMLGTTVFGTCSTVRCITNVIRLKPHLVIMAWNNVGFAGEFGNPEAVNDIVGVEVKLNGCANGNNQFIGSDDVFVYVVELPPPLVADDSHLNIGSGGLGQSKHRVDGTNKHCEQE